MAGDLSGAQLLLAPASYEAAGAFCRRARRISTQATAATAIATIAIASAAAASVTISQTGQPLEAGSTGSGTTSAEATSDSNPATTTPRTFLPMGRSVAPLPILGQQRARNALPHPDPWRLAPVARSWPGRRPHEKCGCFGDTMLQSALSQCEGRGRGDASWFGVERREAT